jgi:hypothetical protein
MLFSVSSKMYQLEAMQREQTMYIIVYAFVVSSHDGFVSYVQSPNSCQIVGDGGFALPQSRLNKRPS